MDGSIDFGRTSSCFRLMSGDLPVDPVASEAAFDYSRSPDLKALLDKYNVVHIEVKMDLLLLLPLLLSTNMMLSTSRKIKSFVVVTTRRYRRCRSQGNFPYGQAHTYLLIGTRHSLFWHERPLLTKINVITGRQHG